MRGLCGPPVLAPALACPELSMADIGISSQRVAQPARGRAQALPLVGPTLGQMAQTHFRDKVIPGMGASQGGHPGGGELWRT